MVYQIPLFDLNFDEKEEQAVLEAIRSRWISMGQRVQQVEEEFSRRLGVRHVIAVTNGTAALHLALAGLEIRPGDEVIVPSLTFVATANAVRYVGATPVFADIVGPHDLTIDPVDIERLVTKKTKAVMVMHYGGFACDMERIRAIAKKHRLFVVEDAAHAPDVMCRGKKLGVWGDAGAFSFFSNKNITCAEGGMVVTDDERAAQRIRLMRSHGMTTLSYERAKGHATKYDVLELGYNYRMDDVRAAILLSQMEKLDEDRRKRNAVRRKYVQALSEVDELVIPFKDYPQETSNYIFPVLLKEGTSDQREELRQKLAEAGIQTSVHYPAVHRFAIYEPYRRPLPRTEFAADHLITLPMFAGLREEQVEYIVKILKEGLVRYGQPA